LSGQGGAISLARPGKSTQGAMEVAAAPFAIMNPLGNLAIFLSIAADRSGAERGRIAATTAGSVAPRLST